MSNISLAVDLDNTSELLDLKVPGFVFAIMILSILTLPVIFLIQADSNLKRIYALLLIFVELYLYYKVRLFFSGGSETFRHVNDESM